MPTAPTPTKPSSSSRNCSRASSEKNERRSDEATKRRREERRSFPFVASSLVYSVFVALLTHGDPQRHRRFARGGDQHGGRAGRRGSGHSPPDRPRRRPAGRNPAARQAIANTVVDLTRLRDEVTA